MQGDWAGGWVREKVLDRKAAPRRRGCVVLNQVCPWYGRVWEGGVCAREKETGRGGCLPACVQTCAVRHGAAGVGQSLWEGSESRPGEKVRSAWRGSRGPGGARGRCT